MSADGDVDSLDESDKSSSSSPPSAHAPWWKEKKAARPWVDKPRRKKTVPPEQAEGFARARRSVARAAKSVLGAAVTVAHEALLLSAEPLQLAPVPGLGEAARTLLAVWDALAQVETNRMACVSLVERCADILFAVREELELAGGQVTATLRDPVNKLTDAFKLTQNTMIRQWDKPFLKRYLQRDADLRRIDACNTALTDAVSLFSLSIQIRTLQHLQEAEAARRHDMSLFRPSVLPLPTIYPPSPPPPFLELSSLSSAPSVLNAHPAAQDILPSIHRLQNKASVIDSHLDAEDLRSILRVALHEPDDASMIRMLQIDRPDWPEAIKTLQRTLEDMRSKDDKSEETTIHREFVESGIDCLRRMSGEGDTAVPSWTITKYEVDTDSLIGVGSFSSVYRGTWKHRVVAIKILSENTPRELFIHEAHIWAALSHPHVLGILGASSATGEPPWFFVCPYLKNGSLVKYLKRKPPNLNMLSIIHQISLGMRYLHDQEVLHGDLKAANVLIDDALQCVISDFGQSKMKSEIYRLTGHRPPNDKTGTTRWQAPEVLKGETELSMEADVYAYAITCVEILTGGDIPWSGLDDLAVRSLVMNEDRRPPIPSTHQTSFGLITLIKSCWDTNISLRPSFEAITSSTEQLLSGFGPHEQDLTPSKQPKQIVEHHHKPSPDIRPTRMTSSIESGLLLDDTTTPSASIPTLPVKKKRASSPLRGLGLTGVDQETSETSSSYATAATHSPDDSHKSSDLLATVDPSKTPKASPQELPGGDEMPSHNEWEHTLVTRASSLFSSTASTRDTNPEWDGYDSPPPMDDVIAMRRDERRYRLLLTHSSYPSLRLPLWTPSPVRVGALGFHSKPSGQFITILNAFESASDAANRDDVLPSLYGYGKVTQESVRQDSRSAKERAVEGLKSLIPFRRVDGSSTRRTSLPLRAAHKHAYLYAETTLYRYMNDLTAARKWFKANIDTILKIYGPIHRLQREDILLVIGTLEAPDYALFVSHKSRDGQLHFNVFNDRRNGQKWGEFTMDESLSQGSPTGGPAWSENEEQPVEEVYAAKVSVVGDSIKGWDSLILARLRFRPDEVDPTSQ